MLVRRLQERVPSAEVSEIVYSPDHELVFDKVSNDGSGKCGLIRADGGGGIVYGVVFDMDQDHLPNLDKAEAAGYGYERGKITVLSLANDTPIRAETYYPTKRDPALKPYDWYHALVLEGLREHHLPPEYLAFVEGFETIPDPNAQRSKQNWALIRQPQKSVLSLAFE